MDKQRDDQRRIRLVNSFTDEESFERLAGASRVETAEYLAQMVSELVTLANTARLGRLSVLLDLVRREAKAEVAASSA
jgi:hypothetical protein